VAYSPDTTRRGLGLLLSLALLLAALLPPPVSAQTRRSRRGTSRAAVAKPSPTPIAVPRLPAASAQATPQRTPAPRPAAPQQTPARPTPSPTPAPADEDAIDESEVVRVTSNLVVVPVSVTDAAGEAVPGLKKEDFKLEEEGRAQEIAEVGGADVVPLDIAVVFDVSSSVTKNFEFEKQAAAGFLKQVLKPIDRAAVFSIVERPRLEQPLSSAETATVKLLTIPPAEKATGTAFYDTVSEAARYLAKNAPERNRRVILVISDGEDNFSNDVRDAMMAEGKQGRTQAEAMEHQKGLHARAAQKVLREVQRADAVFYSINPSGPGLRLNIISQRAQDQMKMLADTTGGNSFVPPRLEDLDTIFRQIAAELRAQYLLQYLSNNEAQPGKFLRIKVDTPAKPGLKVRARQGYFKKG
jgi:Ca-activated chloride channel family protein